MQGRLVLGLALLQATLAQKLAPTVLPASPKPYYEGYWDTIPTAFHGANKSGVYSDAAVSQLALHHMVTIEKWYTPCGSQGPTQGPPSCYVEHKIEDVLGQIKKLNPKLTGILYYNSMFNFNFYHLNGMMEAAEAKVRTLFGTSLLFKNAVFPSLFIRKHFKKST